MRRDQTPHDIAIRQRRERRDFGDKAHHQDQRAIGAEPAVAHDLQLRGGIAAAAETVGDVGKAILVQRAGQERARPERQRSCCEIGQAERAQSETEEAHRPADGRADQRKHPVRADEMSGYGAFRMRHRQPGQKGNRGPEIVEPIIHDGEPA